MFNHRKPLYQINKERKSVKKLSELYLLLKLAMESNNYEMIIYIHFDNQMEISLIPSVYNF